MSVEKLYYESKHFPYDTLPEYIDQVPNIISQINHTKQEIISFEILYSGNEFSNQFVEWLLNQGCQEKEIIYINF